ncbi:MAG TPA: DUF2264 domain-containing protein [Candidatus Alistipes intestinigallinarum]|uniref:DUF2264 domain-containing protein n=1 Tax=Candidatus Alistipes intestinigallinarum TaxID=2838440 RepID=A0A9D2CB00_9BACT|nr:DUF2264 domain-containing protein [Candidatus Alistipes intestinigallinarum]
MMKYLFLVLSLWLGTPLWAKSSPQKERELWVESLTRIAGPVLENLSRGTLRQQMPLEFRYRQDSARLSDVMVLECFGRVMYGICPWLELGADDTKEGRLRARYIDMAVRSLENILDPTSPDRANFRQHHQPLVDAALLVQGLIRAPKQVWERLDEPTRQRLYDELRECVKIEPYVNNWLLFPAVIEAFLLDKTGTCDLDRIEYGLKKHIEWYKGDAWYGDGKDFHYDYYNSIMIHPLLYDILTILSRHDLGDNAFLQEETRRFGRYAAQLERMISPEGTYPVIGRSLSYRFGVLNTLSRASLLGVLPEYPAPAQVRCALTAVISRQLDRRDNFRNGWLRLGFCGHQPEIAEGYISTASLYFCTSLFAALGLPPESAFWSDPCQPWTSVRAWGGEPLQIDRSMTHN